MTGRVGPELLTDGLLRRSEAQRAGSTVESSGSERPHRSQCGAQFVLVVPKQRRLSGAHCWTDGPVLELNPDYQQLLIKGSCFTRSEAGSQSGSQTPSGRFVPKQTPSDWVRPETCTEHNIWVSKVTIQTSVQDPAPLTEVGGVGSGS